MYSLRNTYLFRICPLFCYAKQCNIINAFCYLNEYVELYRSQHRSRSCPSLSNRYGALECEGLATEDVGEGEAPSRGLPRTSQTAPIITTVSTKKKRRVIVIGDSFLRGTEGPICRPDPSHREVCCLPGARVKDVAKKLPGLVRPCDYYPLLVMQVGGDEVAERSP